MRFVLGSVMVCGLACASSAQAQTVALSVHGGYDLPTRQPLTGLDLAFHHDKLQGFSFVGRVQANAALADLRPMGKLELGFAGVTGTKPGRAMRAGLIVGSSVYVAPYPLPLQVGGTPDPDGLGGVGFLPYGQILLEFAWHRDIDKGLLDYNVGFKAGASAAVAYAPCEDDAADACISTGATFVGGLTARFRFVKGLHMELVAGSTAMFAIGYAF